MMKNIYYNPSSKDLSQSWYLIDAKDQTLGKVAAKAAMLLMGKHEATYVPHLDNGHRVIIINVSSLALDPKKADSKLYWRHTGYPGGIKKETLGSLTSRRPTEPLRKAIKGMLPKNRLGLASLTKLYLYAEATHEQIAQQPELITV
jgi:large subunit ribosomal protein L13